MLEALEQVATGEVTVASRDVELDGVDVRKGAWLGLADGAAVASSPDFDEVAFAVADRLLADGREVLTLLTGEDEPELDGLLRRVREQHPGRRARRPARRPAPLSAAPLGRVGRKVPSVEAGPRRSASCSSRTTTSSARRSISCSSCRTGSRSSARSPTGTAPSAPAASIDPHVLRDGLPAAGHGRRRDDASRLTRGLPGRRRRLPDRVGEPARARGAHGRRVRSPACARTRSSTRSSPRSARPATRSAMNLTTREHGDRPRLDRRLPGRPDPLPEHARRAALRPLRRGELPRLRRARPARLLRAAAHRRRAADDLAADAAGLPLRPTSARGLRADLLAPHLVEALGHVPERVARGRRRSAATGSASSTPSRRRSGSGCSRSRSRSCSPAARPTRRSRRSPRATASARHPLHRRHARVPRQGRPHRARQGVDGQPAEREADPGDRRRRGRAGEQGARASRRRSRSSASGSRRRRPTAPGSASGSRTPRPRKRSSSCGRSCSRAARRPRSSS